MGWMFMFAACINCSRPFSFNPDKVPSTMINGQREPVCRPCVDRLNELKKKAGLPEIKIHPDAYQEAEVFP